MSKEDETAVNMKTTLSEFLNEYLRIPAIETESGFVITLGAYDRVNIAIESDVTENFAMFNVFTDSETRVVDVYFQEYPGAPTESYKEVIEDFRKSEVIDGLFSTVMFEVHPDGSFSPLDSGVEQ